MRQRRPVEDEERIVPQLQVVKECMHVQRRLVCIKPVEQELQTRVEDVSEEMPDDTWRRACEHVNWASGVLPADLAHREGFENGERAHEVGKVGEAEYAYGVEVKVAHRAKFG